MNVLMRSYVRTRHWAASRAKIRLIRLVVLGKQYHVIKYKTLDDSGTSRLAIVNGVSDFNDVLLCEL